jgi:hypothetical protein
VVVNRLVHQSWQRQKSWRLIQKHGVMHASKHWSPHVPKPSISTNNPGNTHCERLHAIKALINLRHILCRTTSTKAPIALQTFQHTLCKAFHNLPAHTVRSSIPQTFQHTLCKAFHNLPAHTVRSNIPSKHRPPNSTHCAKQHASNLPAHTVRSSSLVTIPQHNTRIHHTMVTHTE